ncbi:type I signal peptidase SipY [Listeria ivanovii]|uniref:Signal peptidase I n=1 Tax=Listeria ivanovii (strain ATCC BAA-678 / PAM 55) TaxID=881621 RepID=G2ZFJ1_LISIP|nr:type I signal peptidase SipY [Listeria ivanovii]AHI55769.1 signal peptidase [Listeria ivanovii WSLC3009]AIS65213.1 signal peptidase [Listeria ivanovii subsp. ivanovii]MBC1760127.1 type I signal peptidase SipY [Listeria ivanovii]MBK3914633.1 type I signal peptidase SipY [Listeria ivanovii subsp. ivanovii]MBK3921469.1 type I signal peptidase SipY [Listeria ivanovii subsp. ivanovii]
MVENESKTSKKKSGTQQLLSWVLVIVAALAIALVVRNFVIAPVKVEGTSMVPTYQDGDRIFIEKITDPDRFDIIVFDEPPMIGTGEHFIKRVIGVPGDEIAFKNGELYLNGKRKVESYLPEGTLTLWNPDPTQKPYIADYTLEDMTGESTVPKGKLFVLGDNRGGSSDSRVFGFIDDSTVNGTVLQFGN